MKKLLPLLCVILCLALLATPAMAEPETVTVYVDPFNDWTDIYLYLWNDAGAYAEWPGTPMTDGDNDGWYELEVPTGYPNLIVTDNVTAKQTLDVAWDGTSDCWVTVKPKELLNVKYSANTAYLYPGPALSGTEDQPVLDFLCLLGEGAEGLSWDPMDEANRMEQNGAIFTKELFVPAGTEFRFKFCGNGAWDAGFDYGLSDGSGFVYGEAVELESEGLDISLTAASNATLRFTVDTAPLAEGGKPTLLVEQFVETYTVHVDPFDDFENTHLFCWYDVTSTLTPWPGDAMTDADGDGWFELQIPKGYNWLQVNNGAKLASADLSVDGTQEVWVRMTGVEDQTILCDISYSNPGPASGDITPVAGPKLPETLSMVGEGLSGLTEWDRTDPDGIMEEISEGLYVKEILVSGGRELSFKFVGNQDWASGFNFGSATVILGENVRLLNDSESTYLYLTPENGCCLRFTVDLTAFDGKDGATLLVEEVPMDTVTVHVHAFEAWGTPYCAPWKDMGEAESIFYLYESIGEKMTADGEWYTAEIPAWFDHLCFFREDTHEATIDLPLSGTEEVWVVIKDKLGYLEYYAAELYKEEPVLEPEPDIPTAPTEDPDAPTVEPDDPTAPTEESVETESTYPKMTRPKDYDEVAERSEKNEDTGSPLVIILIAVGAVVLIGGVVLIIVLKKKKKA